MKLNIGFSKYDMVMDTTKSITDMFEDGGTTLGFADPLKKKICISNEIPSHTVMEIAMHEITHAMLFETGDMELSSDERFVDAISKQILHFIESNDIEKIRSFLKAA